MNATPHDAVIPGGVEDLIRAMVAPGDLAPWTWQRTEVGARVIVSYYRHDHSGAVLTQRLTRRVPGALGVTTARFAVQFAVSVADDDARALRATLLRAVRAREHEFPWTPLETGARETAPHFSETRFAVAPQDAPGMPDEFSTRLPPNPEAAPRPSAEATAAEAVAAAAEADAKVARAVRHAQAARTLAAWLTLLLGDVARALVPVLSLDLAREGLGAARDEVRAALEAALAGNSLGARAALDRAVALAPERLVVGLAAALAHDLLGDPARALEALEALGRRAPQHAAAVFKARVGIEHRRGWLSEVLATFERARVAGLDDAALLAAVSDACTAARDDATADALLVRAMELAPNDLDLPLRRASIALRADDLATVRAMRAHIDARTTQQSPLTVAFDLAARSTAAGDFDDAAARLARVIAAHPNHRPARRAAAALHLWRGEAEAAAHVLGDDPKAHRHRGVAAWLQGDHPAALAHFESARRDDPRDAEAHVWCAEVLLAQGDPAAAYQLATEAGGLSEDSTSYAAAQFVRQRAALRRGQTLALPEPCAEMLPAFAPGDRLDDARFAAALATMRGNRGWFATRVDDHGGLHRVAIPTSPRELAKHALWRFTLHVDRARAARDFAGIRARWPTAAEPFNYEGEMHLFCGDYPAAQGCFESAIALNPNSRWAFIGLLAVAVLEGRPAAGLEILAEGVRRSGPEGPTAFVYRGEAYRLLGDLSRARADLTHSVTKFPLRVGAWVNLGMVQHAEGDTAGLRQTLGALEAQAPSFVCDLAAALGLETPEVREGRRAGEVLSTALVMLRGNRASSCVTWFTPAGVLRVVLPRAAVPEARGLVDALLAALP